MPIVAILEDDVGRREAMLAATSALATVQVFPSARRMIDWLERHLDECALISLDHDLVGSGDGEGDDPGSGSDVVEFLCGRPPGCPVIVHSSNPLRAPAMVYFLGSKKWRHERVVPFNDLEWVTVAWAPIVRAILAGTHPFAPFE